MHRLLWCMLGSATAFILNNCAPKSCCPPSATSILRCKSQQQEQGGPPSFQEEAQRMLRACGGDINKAMSHMFERGLARIREADPVLFEAIVQTRRRQMLKAQSQTQAQIDELAEIEARLQMLQRDAPQLQDAVRKAVVALTWDTMALYTEANGGGVDAEVNKGLKTIARAIVDKKESLSGPVIDVGCGTGVLLPHLRSQGLSDAADYVGIHVSAEMINIAQITYPKARWVVGDFEKYDFDSKARAIVFNNCLHYFSDHSAVLAKAASMLQRSGKIVISHVSPQDSVTFVENLQARNPLVVSSTLPNEQQLEQLASKINAVRIPRGKLSTKSKTIYLEVLQVQ